MTHPVTTTAQDDDEDDEDDDDDDGDEGGVKEEERGHCVHGARRGRKDEKGKRRETRRGERERDEARRGERGRKGGRKRIKTLAAGRALTITIIYARGALTLTFNVPSPTVKATPDRGCCTRLYATRSTRIISHFLEELILGWDPALLLKPRLKPRLAIIQQ